MIITWKPVNATATRQIGSATKKVIIKGVIVNSHTTATFRFVNGTATNYTSISGTYTPATGSSNLTLDPIEFGAGCYMIVGGTLDATVLYRERDDV
jgi:hypothetical protein